MSNLEKAFAFQVRALKLPEPRRDTKLNDNQKRRWRYDFIFDDAKVIVEVEGGTFVKGRHIRGTAFNSDCHKYAFAMLQGYIVLRIDTIMVRDGTGVDYLSKLLELRS